MVSPKKLLLLWWCSAKTRKQWFSNTMATLISSTWSFESCKEIYIFIDYVQLTSISNEKNDIALKKVNKQSISHGTIVDANYPDDIALLKTRATRRFPFQSRCRGEQLFFLGDIYIYIYMCVCVCTKNHTVLGWDPRFVQYVIPGKPYVGWVGIKNDSSSVGIIL